MLNLKENIVEYRWFNNLFFLFILILTFVSFSRVIGYDFIDWDDYIYIVNNPLITDLSWTNFRQMFFNERHISLVLLSFAIEYHFYGLEPWIYHLTNLMLHILNVILIYFLSKHLRLNNLGVFVAVVLFALHPLRVETVSWVMQRKDLLFTFFYVLGLLLYINYIKKGERNLFLILLVFLMGYLSYLSKVQSITFPIILILIDIFFRIQFNFKNIFEKIFLIFIFTTGQFDIVGWLSLLSIFCIIFLQNLYYIRKTSPFILKREVSNSINLDLKQLIKRYFVLFIIGLMSFFITLSTDFIGIKYLKITYIFIFIYLFILLIDTYKDAIKVKFYLWRFILLIISLSAFIIILILFYNKTFLPLFGKINTSDYSILQRLILSSFSISYYLIKFLFPINLNAVVLLPRVDGFDFPLIYYISFLLPISLVILIFYYIRKHGKHKMSIFFGGLFFIINISLVLHIFPISGRVVVADRYTYFAYYGLFYIVGYLVMYISAKTKTTQFYALLLLLCFVLGVYNYSISAIWENSKTFWQAAIEKDKKNYYAWESLGTLYSSEGDYTKAMEAFNISIMTNPESGTVYNNRGVLKLNTGDYSGAIEDFKLSIHLQNKKGGMLRQSNIFDDVTQLYFNRGNAYLMQKDYQLALNDFNTAIGKHAQISHYYTNRSLVKMLLNDTSGAENDLNIALLINPNDAVAIYNRGLIHAGRNNIRESNFDFALSKSLESDVESLFQQIGLITGISDSLTTGDSAIKSNEYIESGIKKARSGDLESALEDFDQSILLDSTNGFGYRNRCNLKYDMKDYINAVDDCNKAIEHMPNDATSYFIRAKVYNALGNVPAACIDWKKAAGLGDKNAEEMYSLRCK